MTKAELRTLAAAVRREAALAAPNAAEGVWEHWPANLRPRLVSGYSPIRHELDPTPLMCRLTAEGAELCLPVTPPRGSDAPLGFRRWSPGGPLTRSAFGVLEPAPEAAVAEPDLLLVPLLAFSRDGGRLGYGAGHYDRTLAALRARRPVLAIGLAYAAQERADLPLEPHDQPLDGILTEAAYIPVRRDDGCG